MSEEIHESPLPPATLAFRKEFEQRKDEFFAKHWLDLGSGPMHIVCSDYNLEDQSIVWCLNEGRECCGEEWQAPEVVAGMREFAAWLISVPIEVRCPPDVGGCICPACRPKEVDRSE